ncbi:unnamed protein product [Adineta ricciae]|uniref:Uncharacterized protein n=1 Tax=Adineta ricciae TaxID=249248 RepID=A0A815BV03_ADIRI|nr:unnamed protein product [Adineta ricciae]
MFRLNTDLDDLNPFIVQFTKEILSIHFNQCFLKDRRAQSLNHCKITVNLLRKKKAQFSYYGDDDRLVSEVSPTHSQCHVNKPNGKVRITCRTLYFDHFHQ